MDTEIGGNMLKLCCNIIVGLFFLSFVFVNNSFALVGDDTCLECHEDANSTMMISPTKKVSCESCHGSGDVHIEDPSPENIITLLNPTVLQVKKACLQCHSERHSLQTSHFDTNISCLNCHKIMVKQGEKDRHALLAESSSNLCLKCHTDKISTLNLPYSHKADKQEIVCISCHNPHETKVEINTKQIDSKCKECHPEAGGPFMYVHLGTENDGCIECHSPHGSTNSNMLNRQDVRFLCLSCHTDTPTFHNMASSQYQQCTTCHSAIHGSNMNKNFFD